MQFTGSFQGILNHAFLELDVPGEQDEKILDIGCWNIPHSIVTFNFIGIREIDIYASYYEGLSSELANSWNFCCENSLYFGLSKCFQDELVRIIPSKLKLERYEDKFRGILAQKFSNMCKKWSQSSDSEWAVIDGERFDLIHSEIEVPEPSFELIFDIPCLTMIDDTKFMTCKGASIV